MNEAFITEGIENDRCLKAHRLLERFETEVQRELQRWSDNVVDARPDLFKEDVDPDIKCKWDSTIVANVWGNLKMTRASQADGSQLKLNISLRWVDPAGWNEKDVEGALCAACYKINNGDDEDFHEVKEATPEEKWEQLNFDEDQLNNAPGIIYIPVETGEEFRRAGDILIDHFIEFADYWGDTSDSENLTNVQR